jgi:hypothetical protein
MQLRIEGSSLDGCLVQQPQRVAAQRIGWHDLEIIVLHGGRCPGD